MAHLIFARLDSPIGGQRSLILLTSDFAIRLRLGLGPLPGADYLRAAFRGLTGTNELQNFEPNETAWVLSILADPVTPKELARALGVSERMLGRCVNADDSRSSKSSTALPRNHQL